MIEIAKGIFIAEKELVFKFSRSSGPGGQNVNKVNSKAAVFFDLSGSKSLTAAQKRRIVNRLGGRISKSGQLRVVSQRYRTRQANRKAAVLRLGQILSEVLKKQKIREKTKVPGYAKEARIADKKRRGLLKQQRFGQGIEEEL